MSDRGPLKPGLFEELKALTDASLRGEIDAAQIARLEHLLRDWSAMDLYLDLVWESYILATWAKSSEQEVPAAAPLKSVPRRTSPRPGSPARGFFRRVTRPLRRYRGDPRFTLATVWVFTLLFAAGAAGVIAALTTMFRGGSAPGNQQIADRSAVIHSPLPVTDGPVAHLVRTVDCAWVADAEAPQVGDELIGGRKLLLKSGLAEIDFLDGARLLLQGPATLEVRSCAGALLSRGKCSVTVEDPKAHGFIVQTPGMAYTDLGTEFGVLVAQGGEQEVHVFRGKVQADELAEESSETREAVRPPVSRNAQRATASDSSHPSSPISHHATVLLSAHQAIRVAAPGASGSAARPIELIAADDKQFVREMPNALGLVDIVAGGDGTTARSGGGLDPLTGNVTNVKGPNVLGTRDYHKVTAVKYIDGVFVPDGRSGSVQLDSAGHHFALPKTSGRTDHSIFAETVEALATTQRAMSLSRTPLVDNLSAALTRSHPQLYLHANVGITFDLDAIKASQAGCRPARFQTLVCTERSGQPAAAMSAWVFVDGQLCFQRQKFHLRDGYFGIDVPLPRGARFLTLVATDADMDINSDHVIFHCPQLVMEAAE